MIQRCTVPQGTATEPKMSIGKVPFGWVIGEVLRRNACAVSFTDGNGERYIVFRCVSHVDLHVRKLES